MAGDVFALLVGINEYRGSLDPLAGCVDDAGEFEAFLAGRVDEGGLKAEKLLDRAATRQAIIDGFQQHLAQAGPNDVAVFQFSGHGSYEKVEDRFWFLEPTGTNQTLVCCDSRNRGVPDLADKELSALIEVVAAHAGHVVVLLDCCHSGGGTRAAALAPDGVRVRLAPPAAETRGLDTYLPAVRAAVEQAQHAERRRGAHAHDANASITATGSARHVALSACESHQLSKEVPIGGRPRGVFSASLARSLAALGPDATYRDLLRSAAIGVHNLVSDQTPVAYATDTDDLDRPLLGGAVKARRSGITLAHDNRGWTIDAGIVHGIQPPLDGRTTVLAALPAGDATARPTPSPLGRVRVDDVELVAARVEIEGGWEPSPDLQYPAVVVEVPQPPSSVELRGEAAGVALVRETISSSPHVREAAAGKDFGGSRFLVLAGTDELVVALTDGTPLTGPVPATAEGAARIAQRLEHLARWYLTKDLDNPVSALAGKVAIELVPALRGEQPPRPGEHEPLVPDATGDIRLRYRRQSDGWEKPYIFAYIHNRSDRDLYCTLLDLTDRFRCHSKLFPVDRIPAGGMAVAFGGRPIDVSVPEERIRAGGTEVRDWFKVVGSEARFEPDAYDLPNLDGVLDTFRGSVSPADRRLVTRDAGDDAPAAPEWTTAIVSIVTERPSDGVAVPAPGGSVGVTVENADAVTVHGHPALVAVTATLGTSDQAARSASARDVAPPILASEPSVAVTVGFSGTRATEAALDHLVLRGDIRPDAVTATEPLRLRLHVPIGDDDVVLATAREGDLFLPLGVGVPSDGGVDIQLERLPEGAQHGAAGGNGGNGEGAARGIGHAVRIYFQSVLGRRLGVDPGWPRLSLASADGLERDPSAVAAALAGAERVLLVVHGVFGDTRSMLPALLAATADRYDAVLAFDFDTVGTTIEDNAEALGRQLAAAGVAASKGMVDVVAHSVGALVVRWWVEQAGGAPVVRRAVFTGVPNGGTPWARVQGWATSALALGLNGLTSVAWPAAALAWVVAALERADRGIDQLEPGSSVLDQLIKGTAGAAYTVIAGNGSVPPAALGDERAPARRLLGRLASAAAALPFLQQPNDLVVASASMRAFAPGLSPAPSFVEVACDHLTYYEREESIAAIAAALRAREP